MNRRFFLQAAAIAPVIGRAAITPAPSTKSSVPNFVSTKLSVDNGRDGLPTHVPEMDTSCQNCRKVTNAYSMVDHLALHAATIVSQRADARTAVQTYPDLLMSGDSVHDENGCTRIDQHLIVKTTLPAPSALSFWGVWGAEDRGADYTEVNLVVAPCLKALSDLFNSSSAGRRVLMCGRRPAVLPGTGALSRTHTINGITVRAILSYDPRMLVNTVDFDMLFGIIS